MIPTDIMFSVNFLGIFFAALASFVLGALWYSPVLFVKPWMKAAGLGKQDMDKKSAMMIAMVSTALVQLVTAYTLSVVLLNVKAGVGEAVSISALFAVVWLGAATLMHAMFEGRSSTYVLINVGYDVVRFALMGLIIGLMM